LTVQLSPPILEAAGLDTALSWLADKIQSDYGLAVEFVNDSASKPLLPELRFIIYQAARELLINVAKHAGTCRARLSVKREGDMVILTVEDQGDGFDVSQWRKSAKDGCFGLFNVHHRIRHLGGEMDIESAPGAGTRIILRAPLQKISDQETGK
jgi:signal transduction histidine kinase